MGDTNLLKWVSSQAKIKCLQCYHSKMIPYCHIWIIKCNSLQLKQNSRAKVSHYIVAFIPTKTEVNWSQHTSLSNLLQCLWQNLLYMYEKKFKRLLCRRNWMEHRWFLLENILSKSMNPSVFFFPTKNKSWNDFTFLLAKQNKAWNNNCFNYVTWRYASIDFSHCSLFSANEARFL